MFKSHESARQFNPHARYHAGIVTMKSILPVGPYAWFPAVLDEALLSTALPRQRASPTVAPLR